MSSDPVTPLIAVDVGNSRIKLGLFDRDSQSEGVVEPSRILELPAEGWDSARLTAWLPAGPAWAEWWIASVNRPATAHLKDWIVRQGSTPSGHSPPIRLLNATDLPVEVRVEHPERVGMDRLAAAAAAARPVPRRGALIVDSGQRDHGRLCVGGGCFLGRSDFAWNGTRGSRAPRVYRFATARPTRPTDRAPSGFGNFNRDGHSQRPILGSRRRGARTGGAIIGWSHAPAGIVPHRRSRTLFGPGADEPGSDRASPGAQRDRACSASIAGPERHGGVPRRKAALPL